MSAPKHTPGPWWANVAMDGARIERAGGSVAWVGPDDTKDAPDGRVVEVLSDEAKASARLIAAAPELLEALEGLLVNHSGRGSPERRIAARDAARAAIAKARGEQ